MNYLKGSAIDFLKIQFRSKPFLEEKFLASVSPEIQAVYRTIMPITHVEAEVGALIFEKAAAILYAHHPHPIRRMGYEHSQHDLNGIYRALLKIMSVPYVIQKTAQLWRTYHLQGEALVVIDKAANRGVMTVNKYPDIPDAYLESTAGYIQGTLELAGAKNIFVQTLRLPGGGQWTVTWS